MSSCIDALDGVIRARQSQLAAQIGIAVQAQKLQAFKDQGEAFTRLLEAAAELSKSLDTGTNFSAIA